MQARVLLVDNDTVTRRLGARMVTNAAKDLGIACKVDSASSGEAAIDFVENNDYQLIIMDVVMDGIGGLVAIQKIRNELKCNTPIVVSSGFLSIEEQLDAKAKSQANGVLPKPFRKVDVAALVRKWVRPSDSVKAPAAAAAAPAPEEEDVMCRIEMRVLVVDNDRVTRMIGVRLLQKAAVSYNIKCHVDSVSTGEKAVEACKKRRYDFVIMDIVMPGIGGLKAMQLIRENSDTRVVISSAFLSLGEQLEVQAKTGANGVLPKPFRPVDMVHQLEQMAPERYRARFQCEPLSADRMSRSLSRSRGADLSSSTGGGSGSRRSDGSRPRSFNGSNRSGGRTSTSNPNSGNRRAMRRSTTLDASPRSPQPNRRASAAAAPATAPVAANGEAAASMPVPVPPAADVPPQPPSEAAQAAAAERAEGGAVLAAAAGDGAAGDVVQDILACMDAMRAKDTKRTGKLNWSKGQVLGEGAFANVYLGLNQDTGEFLAVKELKLLTVTSKPDGTLMNTATNTLRALHMELDVMLSLEHPNIVQCKGSDGPDPNGNLYLLLEYVPGGSIQSMLSQFGAFSEDIVRTYIRQMLTGLEYLHGQNFVHRDIKGANILVTESGVVKLADFGCSLKFDGEALRTSKNKQLLGSIPWMAPEVIRQTGASYASDVWSIGCCMIEMLTGKRPWPEFKNQASLLYHIAHLKSPPPIPPSLSEIGQEFLNSIFEADPDRRPTATQLLTHPFLQGGTPTAAAAAAAAAR